MKYLLTIAINEYNTAPLRGCVTDSNNVVALLQPLGFEVIQLLNNQATKANILLAVSEIGAKLQPNDYLVVHYSGHGSQIPAGSKAADEDDGLTEIICPYDLINVDGSWTDNYISDDEVSALLAKLDETISVEFFLDCCHSGTMTRSISPTSTSRQIDYPLIEGSTLMSDKVIRFAPSCKAKVVTWSGCMDNQTSADAFIDRQYQGAFTNSLIRANSRNVTRQTVYTSTCQWLVAQNFTQKPQLSTACADGSIDMNTPMWQPLNVTSKPFGNRGLMAKIKSMLEI
jgi:hypothetical protein